MSTQHPIRREIRVLTRLAVPVAGGQLASMLLWFVDLLMIGRVGVDALAAASLGRTWLISVLIFAMGLIFGIDPIASQAHGARDRETLGLALQWGVTTALLAGIPSAILWALTGHVMLLSGQEPELARLAQEYALVQIPGLPFYLVFLALRQWLQARGIVRPAMWISILANLANVFANWVLIYGNLGFPALGLPGAGIATALTQVFMFAALILVILRSRLHRGAWCGWSRRAYHLPDLRRVFAFGSPVGIQLGLEFWAFALATLIAGWLGAAELASHTIVINLASVTFMVPMGISSAAVTRVGNLLGAGSPLRAQRASWVALGMGGVAMAFFALLFIWLRHFLPSLYTEDSRVLALSAAILPVAAAFQVFDGLQVVGGGVLRGMGRTRPAAVFNFLAYYVLALPLAIWWALFGGGGLVALWWAQCLGLGVSAALVVLWIHVRGPARDVPEGLDP